MHALPAHGALTGLVWPGSATPRRAAAPAWTVTALALVAAQPSPPRPLALPEDDRAAPRWP